MSQTAEQSGNIILVKCNTKMQITSIMVIFQLPDLDDDSLTIFLPCKTSIIENYYLECDFGGEPYQEMFPALENLFCLLSKMATNEDVPTLLDCHLLGKVLSFIENKMESCKEAPPRKLIPCVVPDCLQLLFSGRTMQ